MQLLHEAWQAGVPKFVAVGTVYADPQFTPVPFQEDELWAEEMLRVQSQAYRQQYSYNSIFLLPVNLYGPGDNFAPQSSHVIPALIKKCLDARVHGTEALEVWGDSASTCEFLYVDDAAEGILLAAEHYDVSLPVHLGSGEEVSMRELVALIARLTGFQGRIIWDPSKPNGPLQPRLDTRGAAEVFGFQAKTALATGLANTVAWYREQVSQRSE